MNIFQNKFLKNITLIFSTILLNFLVLACVAQTKTNESASKNTSAEIENKIDCNSSDPQEMPQWQGTELHKAVLSLDVEKVKKLLKTKINIDERDSYGNTPLISALTLKIPEPAVKENLRNRQKQAKSQFEIARILLEKGANVNIKGYAGKTALIRAVLLDDSAVLNVLTLLVQHKVNLDVQDNEGTTALMEAARTNRINVVKFLLANKAEKKLKNCGNADAFEIARKNNFTEITRLLSENK